MDKIQLYIERNTSLAKGQQRRHVYVAACNLIPHVFGANMRRRIGTLILPAQTSARVTFPVSVNKAEWSPTLPFGQTNYEFGDTNLLARTSIDLKYTNF